MMRLFAALARKRLMIVYRTEISGYANLIKVTCGVGEASLVLTPALDPVMRQPLSIDLLELCHEFCACPVLYYERLLIRVTSRSIDLILCRIRAVLHRACWHAPLEPTLLAVLTFCCSGGVCMI